MKVYIVTGTTDYEGDQVLGVFTSEAAAEAEVTSLETSNSWTFDSYGYDEWETK